MTQIVLSVEDSSLIPSLKQILEAIKGVRIDHLVTKDVEKEKQMITDTITKGYRDAQEGRFVGESLASLDSLIDELRDEKRFSIYLTNISTISSEA